MTSFVAPTVIYPRRHNPIAIMPGRALQMLADPRIIRILRQIRLTPSSLDLTEPKVEKSVRQSKDPWVLIN